MGNDASAVGNLKIVSNMRTEERETEKRERELKKACADFESLFVYYLFKTMRKTVPSGGLLDGFPGKDTYTMIMDQKVAEDLTKRGNGVGLQKILFDQLGKVGPGKN